MANPSVGQVGLWLGQFVDSVAFDRPVHGRQLGLEVAETIVHGSAARPGSGIMGRIDREVQPDGTPWPPNSDRPAGQGYRSQKLKKYGWDDPNRRTSQMLSQVSLEGHTDISPDRIEMHYGTGNAPNTSRSPSGYISDQDKAVTDVQKAEWAHSSGRGFFGVGAGDPENASEVCQDALNQWITDANGGASP